VKRKTGFLMPGFSESSVYGYGVDIPFYWAIAPDYDATFTPGITSQQGVLMQTEFRQRLFDGSYQIRGYGIDQLDPGAFAGQPGNRQFRWGAETKGQFAHGSGVGTASCSPTTPSCRPTRCLSTRIRWRRS
jgi:LPS-assembly protein